MTDFSAVLLDDSLGPKAAKRWQKRRERLSKQVGSPILLTSPPQAPGAENYFTQVLAPVYQEPLLHHLTGINQPGVLLWMDKKESILFLPKHNPSTEFWEGVFLSVGEPLREKEIARLTGITKFLPIGQFEAFLAKKKSELSRIGLFWNESLQGKTLEDCHWEFKAQIEESLHRLKIKSRISNIQNAAFACRLQMDEIEIKLLKEANKKTAQAFKATLKQFSKFKNETEVAGFLQGQLLMQTPHGLSFPAIVATGSNAAVLHYRKNNSLLKKGQLLLLDFGLRHHSMVSDISRTVPVNGRFNPLQKLLYQIVLESQDIVEQKAKAGVSIAALNEACWTFINKQLKKQITDKGGKFKLPYEKAPHNVSHLIGIQVHEGDAFREYRTAPLQPGMVISNEPGLYGEFELKIGPKTYREHLGIRIEDSLLVTKTGVQNLSKDIPKSISKIEALYK